MLREVFMPQELQYEKGYWGDMKSTVFKPFFQRTSDYLHMIFLSLDFVTLVTYLFHL